MCRALLVVGDDGGDSFHNTHLDVVPGKLPVLRTKRQPGLAVRGELQRAADLHRDRGHCCLRCCRICAGGMDDWPEEEAN